MDRQEKHQLSDELAQLYQSHECIFLVGLSGLNAAGALKIRTELHKSGASAIVAKNTVNSIALSESKKHENLKPLLTGQNLTIFSNNGPETAKLLQNLSQEISTISLKAFADTSGVKDASYIKTLASLPSLDTLRSMLLGTISAVPTSIARLVSAVPTSIARVISEHAKQ